MLQRQDLWFVSDELDVKSPSHCQKHPLSVVEPLPVDTVETRKYKHRRSIVYYYVHKNVKQSE